MSKMADLAWDIEYRACELGMSAVDIAKELECPIEIVNSWFKDAGCWDEDAEIESYSIEEVYSAFNTSNS